jgi:hypothetical protein
MHEFFQSHVIDEYGFWIFPIQYRGSQLLIILQLTSNLSVLMPNFIFQNNGDMDLAVCKTNGPIKKKYFNFILQSFIFLSYKI